MRGSLKLKMFLGDKVTGQGRSDKASYCGLGERAEQHAANGSNIICWAHRTGRLCFWNTSRCIFSFGMLNCHSSKF